MRDKRGFFFPAAFQVFSRIVKNKHGRGEEEQEVEDIREREGKEEGDGSRRDALCRAGA